MDSLSLEHDPMRRPAYRRGRSKSSISSTITTATVIVVVIQAIAAAVLCAPFYRNVDFVHTTPLQHDLAPVPTPERRCPPAESRLPAVTRPALCSCDGPRESPPASSTTTSPVTITTTIYRRPHAGHAEDVSGFRTSPLGHLLAAWAIAGGGSGGGGGDGDGDGVGGGTHGCGATSVSGKRIFCAGDGEVRSGCWWRWWWWWFRQEGVVTLERVHDRRPPGGSSIGMKIEKE